MPLTPEKEEKVKSYITKALDRGFSLSVIEAKLREVGYQQEDIAQITRSFTAPEKDSAKPANRKFSLMLLAIIAVVGVLLTAWYFAPQGTCGEESCFTETANRCGTAEYTATVAGTTVQHRVTECGYTRTVLAVSPDEPAEVRELFMGKSLTCAYGEGTFNSNWLITFSTDLGACDGELRDAIEAVAQAQKELGII